MSWLSLCPSGGDRDVRNSSEVDQRDGGGEGGREGCSAEVRPGDLNQTNKYNQQRNRTKKQNKLSNKIREGCSAVVSQKIGNIVKDVKIYIRDID